MKRWALLVALSGCASLPVTSSSPTAGGGGDVVVPDLVGKTPEEAAALVEAAGFTQAVESSRPVECEGAPQVDGLVNCQSPQAGETVKSYVGVQINVFHAQHFASSLVRDQLLALIGLSEDAARATLLRYGHDGFVSASYGPAHVEGCGEELVCSFDVPESGIGIHDGITLYLNPPAD